MTRPRPRISVFPKCYFDELCQGKRDYLEWLRQAATLGAEGVEHYDGFFRGFDDAHLAPVLKVLAETGQPSSLLCFSPDFTHPDAGERDRQVARQKTAIDLCVRLGIRFCRTLSGQNFPGLSRKDGVQRTVEGIKRSLEYAERQNVVLCMENHYKDGNWQYPEFALPEDVFLEIVEQIDSPFFGVQYDPSNAVVGGFDPIRFLEKVGASGRVDARLGPISRSRRQPRRPPAIGWNHRLLGQAAARRDGQGAQRLRRHLPHPVRRRLCRLDLGRGWGKRTRRTAAVSRIPRKEAGAVLWMKPASGLFHEAVIPDSAHCENHCAGRCGQRPSGVPAPLGHAADAGAAVTLVNEAPVVPYSAMVPAHLGGDYTSDEITIDLVRLCRAVNVRFVAERITGVDPTARRILFASRPPLVYDALSLGLGSIPARPAGAGASGFSLLLRPLQKLLRKIDELEKQLQRTEKPFHLVVVGGGDSGCELALAIHKRLGRHPGFRVMLLQGNQRLLPSFPLRVARAFEKAFQQRSITFRVNATVIGSEEGFLLLEGGERIACDAVLWATQAAASPLLWESGLAVDAGGFLQVKDTLQSVSDPLVFGTGDCISLPTYPDLPKNGVYAVREGRILFDNIVSILKEQPARPFRPQRYCLYLLNTADEQAVLSYGPVAWKSRWARKLKNWIDRAWIDKFTRFAPMTKADAEQSEAGGMHCGGCGSKISSDVLSAVLKRIDLPDDERILLGCRAGEDAAVHRVRPELFGPEPDRLLEVQTVDYFKAFIDDPYLFGRIAALNAVSDVYAMNARPFTALAIATLPYARADPGSATL